MNVYVNAVKLNKENDGPVGIANVSFDNKFKVKGIKVINGKNGLFVGMPTYLSNTLNENGDNVFKDVCNPITKEFREDLNKAVLESFETGDTKTFTLTGDELSFESRVTPIDREDSALKGIGNMVINGSFAVNNIRILEGKNKDFVDMPSYKSNELDDNGKPVYKDYCYGTDYKTKAAIEKSIMEAYEKKLERPSISEALKASNEKAESAKSSEPKTKKKELAK